MFDGLQPRRPETGGAFLCHSTSIAAHRFFGSSKTLHIACKSSHINFKKI
jgi:hypothetical protein